MIMENPFSTENYYSYSVKILRTEKRLHDHDRRRRGRRRGRARGRPQTSGSGMAGPAAGPASDLGQRDGGVGEAGGVQGPGRADERLDVVVDVPDDDVHARHQLTFLEPEGDELQARAVAAVD